MITDSLRHHYRRLFSVKPSIDTGRARFVSILIQITNPNPGPQFHPISDLQSNHIDDPHSNPINPILILVFKHILILVLNTTLILS